MKRTVQWVKGHGTENDFLLLPDYAGDEHPHLDPALVAALCHRRRGVGADGVLRVVRTSAYGSAAPASGGEAEWFMDYRNADGSTAQVCGNGLRVFALYLAEAGLIDPARPVPIGTRSGVRTVEFGPDGRLTVDMGRPILGGETKIGVGARSWAAQLVDLGNPHAVAFVDDVAEAGPLATAPAYDPGDFPHGVNVEFVARPRPGHLDLRVYERGVGETRSCGTGACAAAVAAAVAVAAERPVDYRVSVPGGQLDVRWRADGAVELTGPAEVVAHGEFWWPAR